MALSCPLTGISAVSRKDNFPEDYIVLRDFVFPFNCFINQAYSVKMIGYWPRSFLIVYGPSRSINTVKENLGQYPAILTSCLLDNPDIFSCSLQLYLLAVSTIFGIILLTISSFVKNPPSQWSTYLNTEKRYQPIQGAFTNGSI